MIVLDTNVLSEVTRPDPFEHVVAWVDRFDEELLFVTSITAAELRGGVEKLPDGRRKRELGAQVERLVVETFSQRVLPFDVESSVEFAVVVGSRTRAGRPIGTPDAQIAAICRQHNATLATRNVRDFEGVGVDVVNPWDG